MAGSVLVIIPSLIEFALVWQYFIKDTTAGLVMKE